MKIFRFKLVAPGSSLCKVGGMIMNIVRRWILASLTLIVSLNIREDLGI